MDSAALSSAFVVIVVAAILGAVAYFLKRRAKMRLRGPGKCFSDGEYDRHHEAKREALERILGPMHDLVGHAVIPFCLGGAVDMYRFPSGIPGTGFATMELIMPDGSGPKPNRLGTFELVAFTKQRMPSPDTNASDEPFEKIESRICGFLTATAIYSCDVALNPGDTCEIPTEDGSPNRCLIVDEYKPHGSDFTIDGKRHCLLLCLEVFPSEMKHAAEKGSADVLAALKAAGHYPYSDLDREPVR